MSFITPRMNGLICSVTNNPDEVIKQLREFGGYKPYCPVNLNGQNTSALVDSGNMVVNAISEKYATRIFGDKLSEHLRPFSTSIGTAKKGSKHNLDIIGVLNHPMKLRLGGLPRTFRTRPLVIRNFSSDMNISGPFMAKNGIDHLHSQGCLMVMGKKIMLMTRSQPRRIEALTISSEAEEVTTPHDSHRNHQQKEKVSKKGGESSQLSYAYVAEDRIIPANSAIFLRMRIPDIEKRKVKPGEGLLHVGEKFMETSEAHPVICAMVRTDRNGNTYTSVMNSSNEEVEIKEGKLYGTYHPKVVSKKKEGEATLKPKTGKPRTTLEKIAWLEKEFKLTEAPWLRKEPRFQASAIDLLLEYYDICSHDDEYGKTTLVEHEIHTADVPPIRCKGRPINPVMQENFKEQLDLWKSQGVIEPSSSPWSFCLLPVPKKNGKVRWCVDYRKLNEVTLKDSFPLPNIEDNLARLAHSCVFSVVDGAGAFHVVAIREEDREKTAFQTPYGLYQFKQMPFGLCNAPATYSRLVQKVLENIPTSVALPYLDDTCIHSADMTQHLVALRQVFEAHKKAGLLLQPSKCKLFQEKVEYLGHMVSKEGIQPIPEYVSLVKDWPLPTTIKELRTFLGKAAYYRKFIEQFSHISSPLYSLLSKEADQDPRKLKMGLKEEHAFAQIKRALTSAPLLAYPDFTSPSPFILGY